MKKVSKTLCLSLLALSSAAFAHTGHFYLGADAGIFTGNFDNSYLDQTDTIVQNYQNTVTQNGYTGGLMLGYSKPVRHNYFMGVEVSGNGDSSNARYASGAPSSAFSDKTQLNAHMDFDVVPGIKLTDTISAFMKLGLSLGWIQDNLTSPVGFTPVITNYANNNTAVGFALGLGVAKSICKHMSLFTEADYHDYGKVNFQNFQDFSATYSHSTRVTTYDVVVGAAYKFV